MPTRRSFGTIEYRFSLTLLQITIKLYLNKITKVTVWHAINLCDLTPKSYERLGILKGSIDLQNTYIAIIIMYLFHFQWM